MTLYAVKDIKPNPFRHIKRYPIRSEKVTALRESIRTTGFWDNVVARSKDGKAEIAYGHHRLVALTKEFGPNHKVELIIRKLDDESMIQIMARENMEEWGTSASVEQETIRAVVEAYADGLITLPSTKDARKSELRYAPSFTAGGDEPSGVRAPGKPYTARTLAQFIGWKQPNAEPQDKVYSALTALEFIEEGLLKESDFEGLTTKQAEAVVAEARKAKNRREAEAKVHRMHAEQAERDAKAAQQRREEAERERRRREADARAAQDAATRRRAEEDAKRLTREKAEAERTRQTAVKREQVERQKERSSVQEGRRRATAVGRAVSDSLKKGKSGYRQASEVAMKVEGKKADGAPPYIEEYARKLATDLNLILDPVRDRSRVERLTQLVQYAEYLNDYTRADLARTLQVVANRALDYAKQFGGGAAIPASNRLSLPPKRS